MSQLSLLFGMERALSKAEALTFTWRVKGGKQVDEKRDRGQVCYIVLRDVEAETSGEQSPCHLREGEQQQRSPPVRIDGPDGRPSKDEVHETKAEGCNEGLAFTGTSLSEHGRGIKCNDVDTWVRPQISKSLWSCVWKDRLVSTYRTSAELSSRSTKQEYHV